MTCEVDVILDEARWIEALDLAPIADRAAAATLQHLKVQFDTEIALLATNDGRISTLNRDFRGKDRPTNVLSWPAEEVAPPSPGAPPGPLNPDPSGQPTFLGDVAIAFETCLREANAAQKPFNDHVTHLMVHAILHLFGYDHETDLDAALMENLEVAILAELGIGSPYV